MRRTTGGRGREGLQLELFAFCGGERDGRGRASRPTVVRPDDLLVQLHRRGATRLERVRLRPNRTVLWSLTRGGRVLNLHEAFAAAPPRILDDLALLAREAARRTHRVREAARRVREWPPVTEAMEGLRLRQVSAELAMAPEGVAVLPTAPCSGTRQERERVRTLFLRFNILRFGSLLPPGLPIRLSGRMRRRLGHMRPGTGKGGVRLVLEIALNRALLLPENRRILEDTLLHEMAHAVDWLLNGHAGHGPSWKAWALRAGCHPAACSALPFVEPGQRRRR